VTPVVLAVDQVLLPVLSVMLSVECVLPECGIMPVCQLEMCLCRDSPVRRESVADVPHSVRVSQGVYCVVLGDVSMSGGIV
jgi:hypothetical protein